MHLDGSKRLEVVSAHILLPRDGMACPDNEHTETRNENHICAVTQHGIAVAILCLYCDLRTFLPV